MAGKLTFRLLELIPHLNRANKAPAEERQPTFAQMYDPACRFDGKEPEGFDAKASDVDLTKLKPSLILVGDHGVYLMAACKMEQVDVKTAGGKTEKRYPVVYALECNPDTMAFDDWYDVKTRVYGGDDGTDALEVAYFEQAAAAMLKRKIPIERIGIQIQLSADSMRFSGVVLSDEKKAAKPAASTASSLGGVS